MTKQEFANLQLLIEGAYNNFEINHLVWYEFLKDYDYKLTLQAVKNVIKVSKYPLTIASITEEYARLKEVKRIEEYNYLYQVANNLFDKGLLTDEEHMRFEFEWQDKQEVNDKLKKKIVSLSKNERVLKILGGRENEKKLLT